MEPPPAGTFFAGKPSPASRPEIVMAKRPEEAGKAQPAPDSEHEDIDQLGGFGRQLRRLYQDTVNEPIPESFNELLSQLDEEEEGREDAENG